jgi:hypothetical protein
MDGCHNARVVSAIVAEVVTDKPLSVANPRMILVGHSFFAVMH